MRRGRRHVARALLGDGLQRYGIDILVKTCDKLAAVDVETHLAADFALDDLRGVLDAERGQDLEEKVERQGVLSGVVGEEVERGLLVLFGRGVLVLETGLVYTQHAEADVGHGLDSAPSSSCSFVLSTSALIFSPARRMHSSPISQIVPYPSLYAVELLSQTSGSWTKINFLNPESSMF